MVAYNMDSRRRFTMTWFPIPRTLNYFVNEHGIVSQDKDGKTKILKQYTHNKTRGHLLVTVMENGDYINRYVHRLVLESIVGPCPLGMECRHIDGNPANNNIENLAWGTRTENIADRKRIGKDNSGQRSYRAKFTEEQVSEMRRLRTEKVKLKDLAIRFNADKRAIWKACRGVTWKIVNSPPAPKIDRQVMIEAFGESKNMKDWSKDQRCTVKYTTFRKRLVEGWNPESAMTHHLLR